MAIVLHHRLLPAALAFALALASLVPPALTLPQHLDEVQYTYISAYYGGKISRLDFRPTIGEDQYLDPGWAPLAWWSLTQPMGPRFIYAAVLGVTRAPPPALPFILDDFLSTDPAVTLTDYTRTVMRFTAIFFAALGCALLAFRFRWAGLLAIALFLLVPQARDDLARGWAEGPLLFAFGLAAVTYGTRWFAPVCGLALAMKLTALPLLLLAFHNGFGESRFRHVAGFLVAWLVWTALMPPAWFSAGPLYLVMMIQARFIEFGRQSSALNAEVWGSVFGHYLPSRYLWPAELALALTVAWLAARARHWQRLRLS
ncbi:MAG: hypothetical protein M1401_14945 [Chloroflexi bacterium]|nr:hypothetical protein [Chloroflexota bacterium]